MNHYPHNIGDYLKDTLGLTMERDGAYRRLLDQYYASESPLPLDREELYGIARCRNEVESEAVEYILAKYFAKTADGYRHKRCDVELEALIEKSTSASRSAKLRWESAHAKAHATADATAQPDAYANADTTAYADAMLDKNQEPRTKNQKNKDTRARETPIPEPFVISDRVKAWAQEKGHERLEEHREHFVGTSKAKGYTYRDWDEAFMNAIRKDWAGLGKENNGRRTGTYESRIDQEERIAAGLTGSRKGRTIDSPR